MKVKIFTYPDGRHAFATGNIEIEVNKQKPIDEVQMNMDDNQKEELFNNPKDFQIKFDKDKQPRIERINIKKTKE